ncbi:hypothetical protein OHV13_30040 [Kitasatospora purpeofusca]|uniref:RCC1-like domain-containing protein n=1 Tax=Kitasatospora purpeofusca TaxID=67352 RepID=UPI003243AED2
MSTLRPHRRKSLTAAALTGSLLAVLILSGSAAGSPDPRALRPGIPGTAFTWGSNVEGQLGDGTTVEQSTSPTPVCGAAPCTDPLQGVIAVSGGGGHSVALRSDGTVVTWGDNTHGQLGDGTTTNSTTPVRVCAVGQIAPCSAFLDDIVAVAAGAAHTTALRAGGTVVTWGLNEHGQLGNPITTDSSAPVPVCLTSDCGYLLNDVVSIAAGAEHNLALHTNGEVDTWGDDRHSQLGRPTSTGQVSHVCAEDPFDYCRPLQNVASVAAGGDHSVVVRLDGTVQAWGENDLGQLGDGTTTEQLVPVHVCDTGAIAPCGALLSGVTSVAAGDKHTVALRSDGGVRVWGGAGRLGNGTGDGSTTPVAVCAEGATAPCADLLSGVTALAAGGGHSVALASDGTVLTWGGNESGELGNGTSSTAGSNAPVHVCAAGQSAPCDGQLTCAVAVGAGYSHTLAVIRP